MSEKIKLEICLDSPDSVALAQKGGADRVELCDNLFGGGTTPSIGAVKAARRIATNIMVHVIIRPRPGDFCYTDLEFETMLEDVKACREAGADGVVIGILKPDGTVDLERNAALVDAAAGMNVTFHRAFDVTADPFAAMEDIIGIGCSRILTSGQEASVLEGADLIRSLIETAAGRIILMPGGDITERNLRKNMAAIGAREYHMNLDLPTDSVMKHRPNHVPMGGLLRMPEFSVNYTSPERVRTIRNGLAES